MPNVALPHHPLLGTTHVYAEYLPPVPAEEIDPRYILAPGMSVTIVAAFENWNDVPDLDMFYVYVPATGQHTHLSPRELGSEPPRSDFYQHEYALSDCCWWSVDQGRRPEWARGDCGGRVADTGYQNLNVRCENHVNAWLQHANY